MPSRRTFLITSSLASSAVQAQEKPKNEPARPDAATDSSSDIFEAAFRGDIKRATVLAEQNPAVAKLRSADGLTPLHYAAAGGQPDMMMFLTTKGADLSAGPESPLLTAVDYADHALAYEMAQTILMNASDPNARRKDGKSALDIARGRGYDDIVALLIHRGAAFEGKPGVERVFFGKRYSYNAQGNPYKPQDIAGLPQDFINECVRLSHIDVDRVKHLYKLAPALLGARATWDELPIEAAAHMGLVPLAEFLADQGSPVSTCTAAVLGLNNRVEALVKADANCLRERGAHDIPLLAYTAWGKEQLDIAEFLLNSGAELTARGLGLTTLHIVAMRGHIELAKLLLDRGADVNEPSRQKNGNVTPLTMAVRAKQEKMQQFLKERGGRG
jgi:ankyrin repeat protein